MKRILTATLIVLSFHSFAQPTHQEAKQLLNEASQKMKSYDKLFIEFTYSFENSRVDPPILQQETGTIAVKGDTYRLHFMGTEQIRNGNKVYTVLKADEEVQITDYEEGEDQGLTPSRILNLYEKGYSYKLGETENINGRTIQYVVLKPNASEEIDKIRIGIDKGNLQIHSLKQWGTNGTITTFLVRKFEPNKPLPEGYFQFKKTDYPGYYIAE